MSRAELTHAKRAPITRLTGVWSALPTPFSLSGTLELEPLKALVSWQLSQGVEGVVAYGTTGEAPTLDDHERQRITLACIEASEGRPVVAGIGTNCTRETIRRGRQAREWGASAGLVVTPYYNKPTQEGLERHFSAVAEALEGWPLVIYVVPGRAVVSLDVEVIERLIDRYEHIVAIKDATADLAYAQALVSRCGHRVSVLSGDDPTLLAHAGVGGHGAISVLSNLCPAELSALWRHASQGDHEGAKAYMRALEALACGLFVESNPSPLKQALTWRFTEGEPDLGAGASLSTQAIEALSLLTPMTRLPLTPLSEEGAALLRPAYQRYLELRARCV